MPVTVHTLPRWKKILFAVTLVSIVGLGLEFLSIWFLKTFQGYDGQHLMQYQFDPHKNVRPTPNYVDTRGVEHNSQGFRRLTNVSHDKPIGTYRVFLMGGSTAYGTGGLWPHIEPSFPVLQNSETIDTFLEQYLREQFPEISVEVINAGIVSTWMHHHLIYLNQTILAYDPDMVLFLDGFNDFFHYRPGHDQFASYSYQERSRIIMGKPTVYSLLYTNGWWIFRKSALAHVTLRALRTLKGLATRPPQQPPLDVEGALSGLQQQFPKNALKMIERIGLLLDAEGVTPVFMLQPMLILERDRPLSNDVERRLFDFNVSSHTPDYEAFMHKAVQIVRELEEESVEKTRGEFLDLTNVFADIDGQVYTDYTHLTPHGNAVLARRVGDYLAPIIRRQLTSP
jgi:lysophospholipase L1-like esterase